MPIVSNHSLRRNLIVFLFRHYTTGVQAFEIPLFFYSIGNDKDYVMQCAFIVFILTSFIRNIYSDGIKQKNQNVCHRKFNEEIINQNVTANKYNG